MQMVDTIVVGAGPAGAAAARTLALAGRETVLADKATFPRDKICGDGLTTLCLRELEALDFRVGSLPSYRTIDGALVRSPSGRVVDISLPDGPGNFAAVVRRTEFDQALAEFAVDGGATARFGSKVVAATPKHDRIEVSFESGEVVTAKTCIAADGMWSPMRKLLGLSIEGYRGEWHAFRQYFVDVAPPAASDLWVWFEPDILPGYMWSFPLGDGAANVGFGILRGSGHAIQDMKTLWPDLLERPQVKAVLGESARPESPHRAWPIPARIDQVPLHGPHTLFVGDAAAACDTLTGEGIGQALLTGRAAAQAILDNPGFDAAAKSYSDAVRLELFADHKMSHLLGRMMSKEGVAKAALAAVDINDWTRRNFGRWMFEDYPRAIAATPKRWKSGMFSGDGAQV